MQFNRVCITITHSLMRSTMILCYEHEVPIHEAINGTSNVAITDDPLDRTGPVEGDFDLSEEWGRLMTHAKDVQQGESNRTPAPLIAFPRGSLDLEDFYLRIRRQPENVVNMKKTDDPKKPLSERETIKAKLIDLGIEFKGNAKTDDLKALLSSVEDEDGRTDVQNEG